MPWLYRRRKLILVISGVVLLFGIVLYILQGNNSLPGTICTFIGIMGFAATSTVIRNVELARLLQRERELLVAQGWTVLTKKELDDQRRFIPHHLTYNTNVGLAATVFGATKVVNDHNVTIIRRTWSSGSGRSRVTEDVIEFHVILPGTLPGFARIVPDDSGMLWDNHRTLFAGDERLESNEFNRQSWLVSEPDQLSFAIFSPDAMADWMAQRPRQPIVHAEQEALVVIYDDEQEGYAGWYMSLLPEVERWADRVQHCGMLEKKTFSR